MGANCPHSLLENLLSLTYLVSDYGATGEGRTVSVMVFRPRIPYGTTREQYFQAEFTNVFDTWWTIGMKEVSREEFEADYAWMMPEQVYNMINQENPPGLHWHSQFHYNFS